MKEYTGSLNAQGLRFAIVCARFNEMITKALLEGAVDTLRRHGADEQNLAVAWVPGAFEVPLIAQKFAASKKYDAIICLGAVIRGATPHFDYVAGQVAAGIARLSTEAEIPVIFGILTTNTLEEAIERSGAKWGNKGSESAVAAIEMSSLIEKMTKKSKS